VPLAGRSEVDAAVAAARRAFREYRALSGSQRAKLLWALSLLIDDNAAQLAAIEVLDNGKPLGEAVAVDVALAAEIFRYYAGCASTLEGRSHPTPCRACSPWSTRSRSAWSRR